jgi:hypothetical protein
MKTKFTMFRRGAMFYMQDSATGKQTSLRTKDEAEANSLLNARNAAQQQPTLNLHLARAYLTASDPAFVERTSAPAPSGDGDAARLQRLPARQRAGQERQSAIGLLT